MTTSESPLQTPKIGMSGFRNFQRQLVEFQKAAFEGTFDAIIAFQDQQEQYVNNLLDQSNALPEEGKEVVHEWIDTLKRGRDDFKSTLDKSYELIDQYFDRLEDEQEAEEAEANPPE